MITIRTSQHGLPVIGFEKDRKRRNRKADLSLTRRQLGVEPVKVFQPDSCRCIMHRDLMTLAALQAATWMIANAPLGLTDEEFASQLWEVVVETVNKFSGRHASSVDTRKEVAYV